MMERVLEGTEKIFLDRHLPMSPKKKGLEPVCLTSIDKRVPNRVSYKSISKET